MTTRILPPQEWDRLAGTELETVWPHLVPSRTEILVVEDGDVIVACWAFLLLAHVEGVWIHPAYRKHARVAGRLWQAMRALVREAGFRTVTTGAVTDEVRGLLTHVGAEKLPGDHYVVSIGDQ